MTLNPSSSPWEENTLEVVLTHTAMSEQVNVCWNRSKAHRVLENSFQQFIYDYIFEHLPKKVLFDAANRKHTSDITPRTNKLDTKMGAFFDDLICVICILRWCSIRVPLDLGRYKLNIE
jgi:hypothetical protein